MQLSPLTSPFFFSFFLPLSLEVDILWDTVCLFVSNVFFVAGFRRKKWCAVYIVSSHNSRAAETQSACLPRAAAIVSPPRSLTFRNLEFRLVCVLGNIVGVHLLPCLTLTLPAVLSEVLHCTAPLFCLGLRGCSTRRGYLTREGSWPTRWAWGKRSR